jgi:modulator of FtsH protease
MQSNYQVASTQTLSPAAHKVLRNTYMMLGLTMVPTVIGALIGMSIDFSFAAGSPIIFALVSLAVIYGMFFAVSANRNNSMGVVFLLGLTFIMGALLGPILQVALSLRNGGELVGLAAGGTGIIFLTLSAIASTTKRDFSFMGNFLLVGIILLIVASLANLFFQIPALSLALSGVAVLLFSGFILYDVNRIVHGGETNYVMATLSLYISVYQLFTNLLHLLMAFAGDRE